jgi:hypothetical protein
MAAAPFVAVLKFVNNNGPFQYNCTVSDVAGAFYVFPDANTTLTLPSGGGVCRMVDVILSAAGTDTTQGVINVNQKATGEVVQNGMNLASNLSRQFMGAGVNLAPGSSLRITQA